MRCFSLRLRWSTLLVAVTMLCSGLQPGESRPAEAGRLNGRRSEVLSGTFSGMVVTLSQPPAVVQSWLPEGLRLAASCPYKDRPVIVLIGSIDDLTKEKVITVKPRFGRHYLETFVAVPYLACDQSPGAGPVYYFARVYCDNARAAAIGIRQYGWAKILTPMEAGDRLYRIRGGAGIVLQAEIDQAHAKTVGLSNASLQQIQGMLSQPMVLRHNGSYHPYSFDFHFQTASLTSVPVELELREGFMPQLSPVKTKIPGIADDELGAFYIECRYTKVAIAAPPRRPAAAPSRTAKR
jgi:hypothetical protein